MATTRAASAVGAAAATTRRAAAKAGAAAPSKRSATKAAAGKAGTGTAVSSTGAPNKATLKKAATGATPASAKPASRKAPAVASAAKASRKRQKPVRDSYTMPREDYTMLIALKDRAQTAGRPARKSELLRAGLHALAALDDAQLRVLLDGLVVLEKGRPRKGS